MMATSPLPVTVVIPCFNVEKTVDRALNSIAAQSRPPMEVVVVDDASGDGTLACIRAAATRLHALPIRVLALDRNGGAGEARNAGLAAAADSSYVAFLDADDWWLPGKLERQIGWMDRHPDVGWTAHRCDVGHRSPGGLPATEPTTFPLTVRRLLLRNPVATASVVARRPLVVGFRSGWRHCEDLMTWIDWLESGRRAVMLDEVLACLGRPPASPGGLCGDRLAMYRGEQRVVEDLRRSHRLGPAEALAWKTYVGLRRLAREVRR